MKERETIMSYKLEKPYTDDEKFKFISRYNQDCFQEGYNCRIEETDTVLFALEDNEILVNGEPQINPDYENQLKEKEKILKLEEFKKQLDELDKKRIRAVCEPSMKTETQSWLEYYNEQIAQIRQVMAEL